jgi:hypothetical protein
MKSSSIRGFAVLAILASLLMASGAGAIDLDKVSIDGQVRLRSVYDLREISRFRHHQIYHDLRTRLGVRVDPSDWTFVYLQFQNSRRLGEPSSGDLTDSAVVDMHQAYFDIRHLLLPEIRLQGGRFEMVYGNQRVFGSDNWGNVGRVWDGARLSYVGKFLRADLFRLKLKELNATDKNRDFDITGVYSTIRAISLDLFWFYELNAESAFNGSDKLHRHNIGWFYKYQPSDSTRYLILQGNYQFGKIPVRDYFYNGIQDISAYMLNGEGGMSFYGRLPWRVKVGVDYTSGDNLYDEDEEDTYSAYTDAYYSYHRFHGYMDLFAYSPWSQFGGRLAYTSIHGLLDIYTGVQMFPMERWLTELDLHYFRAADYFAVHPAKPDLTKKLGPEVDLTTEYETNRGAVFTGGFSIFFPESLITLSSWQDQRPFLYGYLMASVTF